MTIITILNTIAILLILNKLAEKSFSCSINKTFSSKIFLGISFSYNQRRFLYIPIRNEKKVELKEDINRLKNGSKQQKIQYLNAKFSWLKNIEEVEQFVKDYSIVDKTIVEDLSNRFRLKKQSPLFQ